MSNIYIVVTKGKLVFATDSKKQADNFMVTLLHAKPRLAPQTAIGTAKSRADLQAVEDAWGSFPIWVEEKWPKNRRKFWAVFIFKNRDASFVLFNASDQKGAEWVADALTDISLDAVVAGGISTDAWYKQHGPSAFLSPL
jgi:hypothetical protein